MSCSFNITKDILQFYNKPYNEREKEEETVMKPHNNSEEIDITQLTKLYNQLLIINRSDGSGSGSGSGDDTEEIFDPVNHILKNMINEMKNIQSNRVLNETTVSIKKISDINFIEDNEFIKKILLYRFLEIQKKILYIETDIVLYNYIIASILNTQNKLKKLSSDGNLFDNNSKNIKLTENIRKLTKYKEGIYNKLQFYLKDDAIKNILLSNKCNYVFLNNQYMERISPKLNVKP